MSSPKYLLIIAETFFTASFAISPNFPVATISLSFPPGVTSDSIGNNIPENAPSAPITANPFTLPILLPEVNITSYSFFLSMYLSAICCSNVLAIFLAAIICFFPTNLASSSFGEFLVEDLGAQNNFLF